MGVIRYRHDNTRSDGVNARLREWRPGPHGDPAGVSEGHGQGGPAAGQHDEDREFCPHLHGPCGDRIDTSSWVSSCGSPPRPWGWTRTPFSPAPCPNESRTHRGGSYVFADIEEMLPLLNEQFNPYLRDITEEDLQVIVRNSDGSCYVTNGTLLDSRWANPTSSGSSSSGGSSSGSTSGSTETQEPAEEEPAEEEPVLPEDGGTGDGTTDPGTGDGETTDPGTGDGTTDPGEGDGSATDPGDGGTDTDPDAGGGTPTDPGDRGRHGYRSGDGPRCRRRRSGPGSRDRASTAAGAHPAGPGDRRDRPRRSPERWRGGRR